jgi:Family of unknown function (DUF6152)
MNFLAYTPAVRLSLIALMPSLALAHHSASVYDTESARTVQGAVARYEWRNPHVYIYLNVDEANGVSREWAVEAEPTAVMARAGWTSTTLVPGEQVSARINLNRNPQSREVRLITLSKADGTLLARKPVGSASAVAASDISGVWDALRGYEKLKLHRGKLTEEGATALAAFDQRESPVKDCLAFSTPMTVFLPYRTEIEIEPERVYIRSEYFETERVIYTDGRPHPANGERAIQGHSIGHWEGDALIVDTTLFTDNPTGNFRGVPSGARRHAVERFALSEDHKQLSVQFSVEDPEFMAEPMTGEVLLDYAPDHEMLPFGCDPEVARRYAN